LLAFKFIVIVIIAVLMYTYMVNQKPVPTPRGMIEGILYASSGSAVVINDTVLKEGDTISGVRIVKIDREKVDFQKDKTHWSQKIGEAPNIMWEQPRYAR